MPKKKWLFSFFLFLLIFSAFHMNSFATPVSSNGLLQVKGSKIVNSKGKTFVLKGVCINWNWDEKEMVYGQNAYKVMRDKWGVNAVRVNTWPEIASSNAVPRLQKVINDASNAGLYVIVNFGIWYQDPNRADYKKNATDVFTAISKTCARRKNILYEICNESSGGWGNIKKFADYMVPVIRKNDPYGIIIVGTPDFCTTFTGIKENPVKDTTKGKNNIAYTIHSYGNWTLSKAKKAVSSGLPLVATEFSPLDGTNGIVYDYANASKWLSFFNSKSIGRFIWALRDRNSFSLINASANKNGNWTDKDLTEHGRWMVKAFTGRTVTPAPKSTVISLKVRKTSVTYTGRALKPGVSSVKVDGKTLSSKYYSVSYKNNVNVGTATVIVTGRGIYQGCSGRSAFSITLKKPSIAKLSAGKNSFSVNRKTDGQESGWQIQYSQIELPRLNRC